MNAFSVLLLGARGNSGNKGVVALTASLTALILREVPNASVAYLLFQHRPETLRIRIDGMTKELPVYNCCLGRGASIKQNLLLLIFVSILARLTLLDSVRRFVCRKFPTIDIICGANLLADIRGGDSFSDLYGLPRFVRATLISLLVMIWRRDVVMLPQTYGPFATRSAKWIARATLRRAGTVYSRDRTSMNVAIEVSGRRDVRLSPDVAFSLASIPPASFEFNPPLPAHRPHIGLNINGLMYNGGYSRKNAFGLEMNYVDFVAELIERFLAESDAPVALIPHTFSLLGDVESDTEACIRARNRLSPEKRARVHVLMAEYDASGIKGVVGQCDFFVGSRMHSCIAALSQGIPCVGVAYSMKFHGVFESVGVGAWVVDGRSTNNDQAIHRILEFYRRRDSVRADLARQAESARSRLSEVFAEIVANTASNR